MEQKLKEIKKIADEMTGICLSKMENNEDYKTAINKLSFLAGRILGVLDREE